MDRRLFLFLSFSLPLPSFLLSFALPHPFILLLDHFLSLSFPFSLLPPLFPSPPFPFLSVELESA